MNYLRQTILSLASSSKHRHDCPSCHGLKTLSITKDRTGVLYNCFRASCNLRGKINTELTAEAIADIISEKEEAEKKKDEPIQHLCPLEDMEKGELDRAIGLLKYYNSYTAYIEKRILIYYDYKYGRLLVLNQHGFQCEGAIGRAFNGETKPKWRKYGLARHPILVPHKGSVYEPVLQDKAILVEDPFSACAVSAVVDGIALLGTHVTHDYIEYLKKWPDLTVALDKDASLKALELSKKLGCKVKILERDLKYEDNGNIKKILEL